MVVAVIGSARVPSSTTALPETRPRGSGADAKPRPWNKPRSAPGARHESSSRTGPTSNLPAIPGATGTTARTLVTGGSHKSTRPRHSVQRSNSIP
jgi:hypothetical protein